MKLLSRTRALLQIRIKVDGMSGDLGEKGRVWLGQELGRVP